MHLIVVNPNTSALHFVTIRFLMMVVTVQEYALYNQPEWYFSIHGNSSI